MLDRFLVKLRAYLTYEQLVDDGRPKPTVVRRCPLMNDGLCLGYCVTNGR